MRLLVDAHVFDDVFQGSRTYLEGLYTHMIHHMDIDFFFAANKEEKLKQILGCQNNIHYLHLNHESSIKRLSCDFPRLIKEYNIDAAHFQYVSPLVKSCKEIVTVHDLLFMDFPHLFPWKYRKKNEFLFKRSANRADLLLTVSDYSKQEIHRHFNIDLDNIHITANSILPISNIGEMPDVKSKYSIDRYILAVGRIEPRKNLLILLEAYIELKLYKDGIQLVFVGAPDLKYDSFFTYYESVDDTIKKMIHFIKVPFVDLVSLYKNATLFVFPSLAEGFGIPPLEAIEYGCPILCSNATAMGEFELPSEITFNPENKEELKAKILKQLQNPYDFRGEKERIFKKYNWQSIADGFYFMLKDKGFLP